MSSKFATALNKYYGSVWYIATFAIVCMVFRTFELTLVAAAVLTVLVAFGLLFHNDLLTLVPFLLMCTFPLTNNTMPTSGYYNEPWKIALLICLLLILLFSFIFNIVYYKKWRNLFKKGYLTVSLCLLTCALVLGGMNTSTFTVKGAALAFSIGIGMFLPYTILLNCIEFKGKETVKYFAWSTLFAALVVGSAVLREYWLHDFDTSEPKSFLFFGFAISNSAAAYVVIAIPFTFYLIYEYKHGYFFMVFVALEIFVIVMTYSRASIIVAIPGAVIVAIVLCFKKKRGRIGYWITFCIVFAVALAILIFMRGKVYDAIKSISADGINDSGRLNIWKLGFTAWKEHPIFGMGMWFMRAEGFAYESFHCTPLTYLFCCGSVGLAAYLYHRYKTVRLVFSCKLTAERVFLGLGVLAMILNALLDIGMTSVSHLLFYSTMITLVELDVNKSRELAGLPSLYVDRTSSVKVHSKKKVRQTA